MTTAPRAFTSYSYGSDAHRKRVLALSERLPELADTEAAVAGWPAG